MPTPTHPVPPAVPCPICDAALVVAVDSPMAEFGSLDIRLHRLACTVCGMQVERAYHPSVGYRPIAR